MNVLKKTLRKEFGHQKYQQYAVSIKKGIKESKAYNTEIFDDIYSMIKGKDESVLLQMQERLNVSLLNSFQIGKNYLSAFLIYLIGFFIVASYAVPVIAYPGLLVMSLLFLLKTYEYVVNKFCYIDAHMVLIYKSVLDKVLQERKTA